MKRIIHIVGSMNRAGAETMVMNLYRNIDKEKYQFDFLYFTSKPCDYDEEIEQLGGEIYRIVSSDVLTRYRKVLSLFKSLDKNTCIHSHMNINNSIYLYLASLAGIKTRISHSHGTAGKYHESLLRKAYKKLSFRFINKYATKYIACGIAAGKYLYPYTSKSDVLILPNAIHVNEFLENRKKYKNYLRELLNIDDDTSIIIQIGRLIEVKNHSFSLELIKYLSQEKSKFHFVIVGEGELLKDIKDTIKAYQLKDMVTLLGVRSDVPRLMAASDCMLMPSLHEGFPVVLVESQATGLPSLISANVSSEVDLGLDLVSFLNLEDDVELWAEKLSDLIDSNKKYDSEILEVMSEKGFNIVNSVKKLEEIYG